MNSDTYVECLVKSKQSAGAKFLVMFLTALTVLLVLAMLVIPFSVVLAVITGVAAYFVNLYTNLEYEYLYLDRDIVIDKIMAKSKRKRVVTYNVDRVEIFAPIKSYHLENYNKRNVKIIDYSIREELQPDRRYAMYYEGGIKVILSPSDEMVKALKNVAPRKVFTD